VRIQRLPDDYAGRNALSPQLENMTMNDNKPARVRTCRGCIQEFTMESAGQRYCPSCRETRAAAMEALRPKICNHCLVEKPALRNGICPECREADWQRRMEEARTKTAAKIARYNAKGGCTCGKPTTDPDDGLCDSCHSKRMEELRQGIKQRRREAHDRYLREEAEKRAAAQAADSGSLADRFDRMTDAQQDAFVAILMAAFGVVAGKPAMVEEAGTPLGAEQIAADNQDDIDAAFNELMGGLDL
jgi:hypothetical protein